MKGKRTIVLATAVLLLGILQSTDFNDYLHQIDLDGNGPVTAVIGLLIGILRLITTTSIFTKDNES